MYIFLRSYLFVVRLHELATTFSHPNFTATPCYTTPQLIIVDDRVMIMGSANVNDRSMMGDRDSEVALRIEDTIHVTSRMVRKWKQKDRTDRDT